MKSKTKKIIIVILILAFLVLLVGLSILYYLNEQSVAILGYHAILPSKLNEKGTELTIDAEKFEEQLKYLKNHNYKTLTLDEYYCWKNKKCKKPHNSVLITFDDGYQNNYEYAFPLLKEYNMNAVVFYIGNNAYTDGNGFMNLETIEKSKVEYPNVEFASHTYSRHQNDAKEYDEVVEDINKMKEILDTKYFAYPHGNYTDDYIKALKDNGYIMAFTFGPGKEHRKSTINDDNYKIPRLNISKSMPMWKFILRLLLTM